MLRSLTILLSIATGCSSGNPLECATPAGQAITNGTSSESYLALGMDEQRAIVRVIDGTGTTGALCSGVFVARDWVATAAHCLVIPNLAVLVSPGGSAPDVTLSAIAKISHPRADFALVQIDLSSLGGASPFEPLPAAQPSAMPLVPGDHAELAGYGISDGRVVGSLRFLVEPVLTVDTDLITVTGSGASGACDGDSGGPLLTRDTSGRAVVVGVLSTGSASCLNDDSYTRLDTLAAWMSGITGALDLAPSCGALDASGRCLDAAAVWCDSGLPRRASCGTGSTCGWSASERGYRCVPGAPTLCR